MLRGRQARSTLELIMSTKLEQFEAALEAAGGQELFFDRLATTEDLEEIARAYGASLRTLYVWRNASEDRREAWSEALRVSGDAYAAESRKLLRELHEASSRVNSARLESAKVALVSERSRNSMKLAAARNPAAYGDRPSVQVQVNNFSGLHLEALKQKGSMGRLGSSQTATEVLALPSGGEVSESVQTISMQAYGD